MRTGRPSKRTPQLEDTITSAIEQGCSRDVAARIARISPATLFRWMDDDPDFCDRIKDADAQMELANLRAIGTASASQWQAAAWKLERKYPDKWARKDAASQQQLDAAIAQGRAMALQEILGSLNKLPPAKRAQLLQAIEDAK